MTGIIKSFLKKLQGYENLSCMVLEATGFFAKNLKNFLDPQFFQTQNPQSLLYFFVFEVPDDSTGSRKTPPHGKTRTRKIPTYQTPPWKIPGPPRKIPTQIIPTLNIPNHFISLTVVLHFFFT